MNDYKLSDETKVSEKMLNRMTKETVYEDKEAGKRITVHSWWVAAGEDDVDEEWEIVKEEDL